MKKIPEPTIDRLSIYLRCLSTLEKEGVETISSQELAARFNLHSAQIRKDLAQFGEFGVRGTGYHVKRLRSCIERILGLDVPRNIGVIGAGNLGRAIADYEGFLETNFTVAALFDNDPAKIGLKTKLGVQIYDVTDLKQVIKDKSLDIIVLALPATVAQQVLDQVVEAGIKAVLSFAPTQLNVPEDVKLKVVDLTVSLDTLSQSLVAHRLEENLLVTDLDP
ncbi:MAG: redox-sensing transcriptional repressor Rex [Acidobacteriota bacterium]|nr:redox-sensing transcriptional repressor Rex [Blastocatellia bacterium]MDW8411632.1 redox-sensing transcriptional repressor Rex [Acidobacteriota bacterium]